MSAKDRQVLYALREANREAGSSKELAIRALIRAGILTKSGNLAKPYKSLCIQPRQA